MGQYEIFEMLKELAHTGQHKYFTVCELKKELKKRGCCLTSLNNCNNHCLRLWACGYLELKGKNIIDRKKMFMIKDKYIQY